MSHSPMDEARSWDFGMVDSDVVAFPVCESNDESYWSLGRLGKSASYWRERNWVEWLTMGAINYIRVSSFRSAAASGRSTKGVTEGSETSISWDSTFSTRSGTVEAVDPGRVTIRRASDGHRYTWRFDSGRPARVSAGQSVRVNQVIASPVDVISQTDLRCPGTLAARSIATLLESRERTQRFTGVKLARLRYQNRYADAVSELTSDAEEDVYVRLEGASYLASICGRGAEALFKPYLESTDQQNQLEAVIALGETDTDESAAMLTAILDDSRHPYFLRSAAAWSLARSTNENATDRLVRAFRDVEHGIREEALEGLIALGGPAVPALLRGLEDSDTDMAAGCAEALRQLRPLTPEVLARLTGKLDSTSSLWTVWLLGHLPREQVAPCIAHLQESAPHLQYAMAVLWAFVESWVARRWETEPSPARLAVERG